LLRVTSGCSLLWKWAFRNHGGQKSNATAELRKLPKVAFRRCFQQWQDRWIKCVCAQGSYFEGDYICVIIYSTTIVLYHISGNFLTAPRNFNVFRSIEISVPMCGF
jgi:hypothetical protein